MTQEVVRGKERHGGDVFPPLRPLRDAWFETVRVPTRRAVVGLVALVLVTATLVGRLGTSTARATATALVVATFVAVAVWRRVRERRLRNSAWVVDALIGRSEPVAARHLTRALTLLDARGAAAVGTSSELARLHLDRSVERVSPERLKVAARRVAARWIVAALLFAVAAFTATVVDPFAVLEGGNILFARRGVAPLTAAWLEDVEVRARPPEYLHLDERRVLGNKTELPRGSLLTVRAKPTHAGRRLLLSDGKIEIPFVDDGNGKVVARWPLGESVSLVAVARFGDVTIEEPTGLAVVSIPDRAPDVKLEGAPKRIALSGEAEVNEIPLRYEVSDDHGLREVHLVLRSGSREERRVLAKLDGETKSDRGGYVLRATDSFVKKSNAPIDVVVEAKDNDTVTGPKWGASPPITLVPPFVAEPEARRIEALLKLRDALVDRLAWRIEKPVPTAPEARRHYVAELVQAAEGDLDLLDSVLVQSYAGVRIPPRIQAMFRAQARRLDDAVRAHARAPGELHQKALVKQSERFLLVVDAAIRGFGVRDARDAAKRLVDVAEDLAGELGFLGRAEATPRPGSRRVEHVDASVAILRGSAAAMARLGPLGRDIGGAIVAALARVERARGQKDLLHAELAARDLVARLRHPDPSFGSQGSGQRAGGESGGTRGSLGDGDEPSDAERAFDEASRDLNEIIRDHAQHKGETEAALAGATPEELAQLAEQAKKHAEAVREAVSSLPSVGGGSDSWTSKGAAAREHGEQMARSLEQGNAADAVQGGKSAMAAMEEAKRQLRGDRFSRFSFGTDSEVERRLDDAKRRLEPEIRWAEEKLDQLKKRAAERAAGELTKKSEGEQRLADRMGKLAERGKQAGAMPAPALESLDAAEKAAREAARALREQNPERGVERQAEAQRHLEMAREAMGEEGQGEGGRTGDDGRQDTGHADIPKADAHKGPEEFRRRVIQGLGQPSGGRLKDAVRRYAEGLLR